MPGRRHVRAPVGRSARGAGRVRAARRDRETERGAGAGVDTGLIVETTDRSSRGDNERRRYYELTANGRLVAVDELTRLQTLVHRTAGHLPGGAPA